MMRVWSIFWFLTVAYTTTSSAINEPLSEWEKLVDSTVTEIRKRRYVHEAEHRIDNLHHHYSTVFEEINTFNRFPTIQEDREYPANVIGDIQTPVHGRYIVMLQSYISDAQLDKTVQILTTANANSEGRVVAKHIKPFRNIGKGFTATLGPKVLGLLQEHPHHYVIEQDMAIKRHSNDHMKEMASYSTNSAKVPWNLDRLDQRDNQLDAQYHPMATGEGVDVYVLDTGIRYTHDDLEGRAFYAGYDAIDQLVGSSEKGVDCNSHGTHCAATVGGKVFGVAKKVTLYAARVLDCTGTGAVSGIIATMEYIVSQREKDLKKNRAVFSMSLGVEKSTAFNEAANAVSKKGIVVVAASGNQGSNSCNYSPGSATDVVSVAASDYSDKAVSFSNMGECVTVFAPGAMIQSASNKCDSCTVTKSGTSMACPHAAGLAAIYLSKNPLLTSAQVKQEMASLATKDAIDLYTQSFGSIDKSVAVQDATPNLLIYAK